MTLTIEQVRDTRFHLARRNGYDPADVDTFVDKVETTLVALAEENATLQQQVATLSSGGGADDGELQRALEERDAELERLRADNQRLRRLLARLRERQRPDTGAPGRWTDRVRRALRG